MLYCGAHRCGVLASYRPPLQRDFRISIKTVPNGEVVNDLIA
jgi:hypothetical protein